MPESLDESMTGMGDAADYDAWADETPQTPGRLTELATQLAELAGLTIGPPLAAEPVTPSVIFKLTCGRCNGTALSLVHLRLDPGVTQEPYDTHLCNGNAEAVIFPFTLAVRGTA